MTEFIDGSTHQRVDVFFAADVALHEDRAAIEARLDFALGFGAALRIQIGEHHVGAFFGEAARGRAAEPARTARDDRNAALES